MLALLLTTFAVTSPSSAYLEQSQLEAEGFVRIKQWIVEPDRRRVEVFSCWATTARRDKEIRIGFSQTREEQRRGLKAGTTSHPQLINDKEESPSGLPLGRNCLYEASSDPVGRPGGSNLKVEGPYESFSARIGPTDYLDDAGNVVKNTQDLAFMAPLLEKWARQVFAHGVGKRLNESSPRQLAGREVRARACAFSGTLFYDLEDWAAARGWSLARREDGSAADLARGGRPLVVPLAGGQALWRGQPVELGDCVAEVGGRWYAPARLDDLAGA
ncbi:MAG: hypothetical protein AB7N10_10345 [Fimbriimonadaceae bacterium]